MYVLVYNICLVYYVPIIKINQVFKYMKKYLPFVILAGLLIFSGCSTATKPVEKNNASLIKQSSKFTDGSYTVDTANSQLVWQASKIVGDDRTGTVDIKSGVLSLNNNSTSTGSFVIDMKTIKESSDTLPLIQHLESSAFFDVANFPESKLEITKMVPESSESNKYLVEGNLTIKDKTNPISFETEVSTENDIVKMLSHFSIDRTKWDVKFGSNKFFDKLGDKAIKDDIGYTINLTAKLNK